ncbi:MAG: uncharacterized protein QOG54_2073 [Actinomycetota bacterium]|jgi:predicted peroxiredoxin|nr:uncharacterized protein [Actinomycetota bacterium]
MSKVMVHITHGPEHPTRVALGFLVAKTAAEEGHDVTVFLAGDAVQFARARVREEAVGVGLGSVAEHTAALMEAGATFYLSRMSSKAREITEDDAASLKAEMTTPQMLVKLSLEQDSMFTY